MKPRERQFSWTDWTTASGTGSSGVIVDPGYEVEVASFHYTSTTATHVGVIRQGDTATQEFVVEIAAANDVVDCNFSHPLWLGNGLSVVVSGGVGKWWIRYRVGQYLA